MELYRRKNVYSMENESNLLNGEHQMEENTKHW